MGFMVLFVESTLLLLQEHRAPSLEAESNIAEA